MEVLHATLADRLKTGTIDEPALTTPDTTIIHPGSRSRQSEYEKVTSPHFRPPRRASGAGTLAVFWACALEWGVLLQLLPYLGSWMSA